MSTTSTSIYTAKARIVGGREGRATAERGFPDLVMHPPAALGGPAEAGESTNPEELFALGFGACFLSTLQFVARGQKISAKAFTLDSTVDMLKDGDAFALAITLDAQMPGVDEAVGRTLIEEAHANCVYSKAVRGNLDVTLLVNGQPV